MNVEDLPTNEAFGEYDWAAILAPSGYVDTTAYEVVSGVAHGPVRAEDILSVPFFWAHSSEGGSQVEVAAVVELLDGWAAVTAGCDYTGWDCQAGAQWRWAPSREQAISQGLTSDEREQLGVTTASTPRALEG